VTDQESYQRKDARLTICDNFVAKHHPGGLCLATEYINTNYKMLWQCKNGHKWKAIWKNVKNNNSWCPFCCSRNKKYTIKEIKEFINSIGYKLISTEYINANTPLKVECNNGHIYYPVFYSLKIGHRCDVCFGKQKLNFIEVNNFIESIGYKLISTEYINAKTPLEIKCNNNHTCYLTLSNLKTGNRCFICSSFKHENECRKILEKILGFLFLPYSFKDFDGQLFKWDGYNEECKIAFEYNGEQHYKFPNYYHRTEEEFIMQIERDTRKLKYALKNGIKLITIPYTEKNNLEEYIKTLLKVDNNE